jgi:heme/copper-type cytochrome/quinol oxidase subunit 3
MAALSYLLIKASVRPEVVLFDFRRQRSRAAVAALYWHFLAGIWLCLFVGLAILAVAPAACARRRVQRRNSASPS